MTSVGSSAFKKKLQRLDQPTLVNVFENEKKLISKKNTTIGFKWSFDPIVVIFFEINFFSFSKKNTSVGWSSRCKFFWNALDPTLVIFLAYFEKIYNDWIKCKLSKSQTKWTGLYWSQKFLVVYVQYRFIYEQCDHASKQLPARSHPALSLLSACSQPAPSPLPAHTQPAPSPLQAQTNKLESNIQNSMFLLLKSYKRFKEQIKTTCY